MILATQEWGEMRSTAETPSLEEVVKGFRKISIDDYQRTYEWDKDSIGELFEDIVSVSVSQEPHFFGTLIFEDKGDGHGSLVDGQQRLTTAFCIVACIRDEIIRGGTEVIPAKTSGMRNLQPLERALDFLHPSNDLAEYRFQTSRILQKTLFTMVFALETSATRVKVKAREAPATLRLRQGVLHIRDLLQKHLHELSPEDRGIELHNLLDSFLGQFKVLFISSKDLNESLDIFLTLNNRGTPLGRGDIVRGLVMKKLGQGETIPRQNEIHSEILNDWHEIIEQVNDPETFMRHFLVSTTRKKVTKKKIVDEVSSRIKPTDGFSALELAENFWANLGESASIYGDIVSAEVNKDLDAELELLNGLLKSHRIPLMAIFRSEMTDSNKKYMFQLVEAISYRWVASGGNAQILENEFQEWAMDLQEGFSAESVRGKMEALLDRLSFDVLSFLRNEGDTSYVVRALLYKLEMKLAKGANPVRSSKIHLEHVAPATSTEDWIRKLVPDSPEESAYQIVNSNAGNLTLLDYKLNTSVKQAGFSVKAEEYQKATLLITRDLGAHFDDWTEELIELRAKWLAECFDSIWNSTSKKRPLKEFSTWVSSRES